MLSDLNRILGLKLHASEMIMRPERETEEHRDPCLEQMGSRYAEGPLRESGPAPENGSAHPRAAAQTCCGDGYASRPVGDTPEPFNAVGVRIIGRRIHQV